MEMNQLCLRLVQTLVSYRHDLMQNVSDVLFSSVYIGPVVSVWRRQSHASLPRVARQIHAAESLHDPGLLVHSQPQHNQCTSTVTEGVNTRGKSTCKGNFSTAFAERETLTVKLYRSLKKIN